MSRARLHAAPASSASNPTHVRLYDCLNAVSGMWLSHDVHDRTLAGFRQRGFASGEMDVLAAVSRVGSEEVAGCLSQRIGNQPAQGATPNKISTQNIVSKMS